MFVLQELLALLLGLGPVESGLWLQARESSLVFLVLLLGILWFLYNSMNSFNFLQMCDVTMELVEILRANNVQLARLVTDLSRELEQEVEQLGVRAAHDSFISFLVAGSLALRNPVLCLWFLWIARDQVKLE